MENDMKGDQITRVLQIYTKLTEGYVVNKAEEALRYGVNERSIQRDIEHIRIFLEEDTVRSGISNSIIYDRFEKGYKLETIYKMRLQNSEVLALCKILLDSRAFTKDEMVDMLDKLITCCVPESNQKMVKSLIKNEEFHYIEPNHKTVFIDKMWDIGKAINNHQYIEITYKGIQGKHGHIRKIKPVAIMFSDYYFYLAAFIDDEETKKNFNLINDANPTIYRIDRLKDYKILEEKFSSPYVNRFEEGEFKKRVQFMFAGKLRRVHFEYRGYSVEAVLDRLPTAEIKRKKFDDDLGRDVYEITAEVYGDGIDMWFRSQGENVRVY